MGNAKGYHFLLLGQGGSGKTHVVQKIVFEAVEYIWPSFGGGNQTLFVVAMSNAQAKNITTIKVKARTAHNASAMRFQQLINSKMRPGNEQKVLISIWNAVRVLVIEEVSMMPAAVYNMLDFRVAHGRSATHDVSEMTYSQKDHDFGRVPIVLHVGDFFN